MYRALRARTAHRARSARGARLKAKRTRRMPRTPREKGPHTLCVGLAQVAEEERRIGKEEAKSRNGTEGLSRLIQKIKIYFLKLSTIKLPAFCWPCGQSLAVFFFLFYLIFRLPFFSGARRV